MNVLWFLIGFFAGFDLVCLYVWLTTRHAARKVAGALDFYRMLNPNLMVFDYTHRQKKKLLPW